MKDFFIEIRHFKEASSKKKKKKKSSQWASVYTELGRGAEGGVGFRKAQDQAHWGSSPLLLTQNPSPRRRF